MIDEDDDDEEQREAAEARRRRREAATVKHVDESHPSDILKKRKIWYFTGIMFLVVLFSIIGSALKFQQHQSPPGSEELNTDKAGRALGANGDYAGNSVSRGDRSSHGSASQQCTPDKLDTYTTAPNATFRDAPGDQLLVCISDLDNQFRFVRLSQVQGIELEKMRRAAKLAEGNGQSSPGAPGSTNPNGAGGGAGRNVATNEGQPQKPRSLLVLNFDDTKPVELAQAHQPPSTAADSLPHSGETIDSLVEKRRRLVEAQQTQALKEALKETSEQPHQKDQGAATERTNRAEESFKPVIAGTPCNGDPMCIVEGDTIMCTLENRIDASFSGPVKCVISDPVLAHNREELLRPGSVILGTAAAVGERDQRRIVVAFHRIIRDDYQAFTLPQTEQGLDPTGAIGIPAHIRRDWAKAFGITLLMGSAAALQVGNGYSGYGYNPATQVRNGYSTEFAHQAQQMFPRNNLPVLTADEGGRISVYFAHDAGPFKRYVKKG